MPGRAALKSRLVLAAVLLAASVSQLVNAQSGEAKPATIDEIAASGAASAVLINGVDASGKPIPTASGFLLAWRLLVTSYAAIKDAVQITAKVGAHEAEPATVAAVSRDRIVALLRLGGDRGPSLGRPYRHPLTTGDTVYSVTSKGAAANPVLPATITTTRSWPAPKYLTLSPAFGQQQNGSAVVSQWGELIGMAGPAGDGSISRVYSIAKIASLLVELGVAQKNSVVTEDDSSVETSAGADDDDTSGFLAKVSPGKEAPGSGETRTIKPGSAVVGMALRRAEPVYPTAARSAAKEGAVVVEIIIDVHGYVSRAAAISGDPLLTGAAVAAARGWLFKPSTFEGKPVKVLGTVTFNFALAPK